MPKVSAIIPNYNHAVYLKQRIDSVLNQTFQDIEVIILDDCSTDNSREIISQYKDHPKVSQIVFNEKNSGSVFRQWSKGISLAKGGYIWIAESDDWCDVQLLDALIAGIDQSTDCTLAYCQSYCVIESNNLMWTSTHKQLSDLQSGKQYIEKYLVQKNSVYNASMALFKKTAFANVGDDYLQFRFAGDWVFWADVAVQGNVFISGRVLNYFRKHKKDVTTPMLASGYVFAEEIDVLNVLLKKQYISQSLFETQLLANWFHYVLQERKFTKENTTNIEMHFYNVAPAKLHAKMKWIAVRNRIAIQVKSFLKR